MSDIKNQKRINQPTAENLKPLEGKELASWRLAPGDIFYQTPTTKKLLKLKRAGELLEVEWIEKYRFNSGLFWHPLVHMKRVDQIVSQWDSLVSKSDSQEFEIALMRFSDEVRAGLHSEGGITLMDWAYTCHKIFKPTEELQLEMLNQHLVLHRRAFYVSSLAIIFALACGYSDPIFLSELYETAWLLDIGLVHNDFTYWISLACQVEKIRPGSGIEFLNCKNASKSEKDLFLSHPELGFKKSMKKRGDKFQNPLLLQCILHHHELADGKGFPKGINQTLLSDWEAILVMADQLVDYKEETLEGYATSSMREIWHSFRKLPSRNLPIQRIVKVIAKWSKEHNLGTLEVAA